MCFINDIRYILQNYAKDCYTAKKNLRREVKLLKAVIFNVNIGIGF
jgi:hypothetical protein